MHHLVEGDTFQIKNKDYVVVIDLLINERMILIVSGFLNSLYITFLTSLYKNARPPFAYIVGDYFFYLINYVGYLVWLTYHYDHEYFRPFFVTFVISIMVLHLCIVEFFPRIMFKLKKIQFNKKWPKTRKRLIDQFLRQNLNFGDFSPVEERNFYNFKKELVIRKQIEFNHRCIKSPVLADDLFIIYFLYLYVMLFSLNKVGYYMPLFFVFLTLKISYMMNRCFIYCKRALACIDFDILRWTQIFELTSILVPIHTMVFLLL